MALIFLHLGHFIILVLIAVKAYKVWAVGSLKSVFFPALILKLSAGILLGIIFKYYYSHGDTWALFEESVALAGQGYENPWLYFKGLLISDYTPNLQSELNFLEQPRALLAAKIVSVISLVTNCNYWLVALYLSLFSFIGFWLLAQQLVKHFPMTKWASAVAFLFLPSVVFWSAGVSKESIVMGAMCIVLALLLPWLVNNEKLRIGQWVVVALGLLVLVGIKYYYAAILIPILLGVIMVSWLPFHPMKKVLSALAVLCLLFFVASWLHPNLQLSRILHVAVTNGQELVSKTSGQGFVTFYNLAPSFKSVALNFPWAVASGFFRPVLWEAETLFQLWIGLENTVLLVLSFAHIIYWRKVNFDILLVASLLYIVLLAGFLAISAPNFGTLVRYKIGFWPFLVYIIIAYNPWLKKRKVFAQ